MKTKTCVRCHEEWPPDTEFYATAESPQCLACDQVAPYWKRYRGEEALERRRKYQREYQATRKGASQ
jgi:hypothetical protein